MWCLNLESNVETCIDRTTWSFDFWFKDFFSNLPLKIIIYSILQCYWQTVHNLILKVCLNFKFSVLTFLRSMTCLISIEQNLCKEKKIQLQSLSNVITCINKRCASKNSGISRLALIFNWSNLRITILNTQNQLQDVTSHIPFLFGRSTNQKYWKIVAHTQGLSNFNPQMLQHFNNY